MQAQISSPIGALQPRGKMTLADDVNLEEFVVAKAELLRTSTRLRYCRPMPG